MFSARNSAFLKHLFCRSALFYLTVEGIFDLFSVVLFNNFLVKRPNFVGKPFIFLTSFLLFTQQSFVLTSKILHTFFQSHFFALKLLCFKFKQTNLYGQSLMLLNDCALRGFAWSLRHSRNLGNRSKVLKWNRKSFIFAWKNRFE